MFGLECLYTVSIYLVVKSRCVGFILESLFCFKVRKALNLKPDVTSYVEKITNDRGNCALVKIITISGEESQAGHVQCLAVEHGSKLCKKNSGFHSISLINTLHSLHG